MNAYVVIENATSTRKQIVSDYSARTLGKCPIGYFLPENIIMGRFKRPSQKYYIYAVLYPCHMLRLARNALA